MVFKDDWQHCNYFLYIHQTIEISIFNIKIMVSMATKTNGSQVTLYEIFFFSTKNQKIDN